MSAKREYEAKRDRSFIPPWKILFSWVDFDPSVPEMFCKICRENPKKADKSGSFFVGTVETIAQVSRQVSLSQCVAAKKTAITPGPLDMWMRRMEVDSS